MQQRACASKRLCCNVPNCNLPNCDDFSCLAEIKSGGFPEACSRNGRGSLVAATITVIGTILLLCCIIKIVLWVCPAATPTCACMGTEAADEAKGTIRLSETEACAVTILPSQHEAIGLYTCPITCEPTNDPVMTCDGFTYEREAIETWLSTSNINPITGAILESKILVPNYAIRQVTQELMRTSVTQFKTFR